MKNTPIIFCAIVLMNLIISCASQENKPEELTEVQKTKIAYSLLDSARIILREGERDQLSTGLALVDSAIGLDSSIRPAYDMKLNYARKLENREMGIETLMEIDSKFEKDAFVKLNLGIALERADRKDEAKLYYLESRDLFETRIEKNKENDRLSRNGLILNYGIATLMANSKVHTPFLDSLLNTLDDPQLKVTVENLAKLEREELLKMGIQ